MNQPARVGVLDGSDGGAGAGGVGSGGVGPANLPPVVDFSGTPRGPSPPTVEAFQDLSTGSPTSWLWERNGGNGWAAFLGNPTQQNPTESFDVGSWSVRLTATNAAGTGTRTKTAYIVVTLPGTAALQGYLAGDVAPGMYPEQLAGADLTLLGPRPPQEAALI